MRNLRIFLLFCTLVTATSVAAAESAEPSGREVWVVQFDGVAGIADVHLLREGNKIVTGFAIETLRNSPWFAETDQLTVAADGRLTGKLVLTPGPDGVAEMGRRLHAARTKTDQPPVVPPATEELTLDLTSREGRIQGTVKAPTATDTGIVGFRKDSATVRGWIYPQMPVADALVEFIPLGVASVGANLDSATGGGVFLFLHLHDGKVRECKLKSIFYPRGSMRPPGIDGLSLVKGDRLQGRIPIVTKEMAGKENGIPELDGFFSVDGTTRYAAASPTISIARPRTPPTTTPTARSILLAALWKWPASRKHPRQPRTSPSREVTLARPQEQRNMTTPLCAILLALATAAIVGTVHIRTAADTGTMASVWLVLNLKVDGERIKGQYELNMAYTQVLRPALTTPFGQTTVRFFL